MTILSPPGWIYDRLSHLAPTFRVEGSAVADAPPRVGNLVPRDLSDALVLGWRDFGETRTDIMFLCAVYPVLGLLLAQAAAGRALLPLIFPLAAGFALLGPIVGLGLIELSRRRELGLPARWNHMFGVLAAPAIGHIALMAAILVGLFLMWQVTALLIFNNTIGPAEPTSIAGFANDLLFTAAGHWLIVFGFAAGFCYAALVLAIGFTTLPMLLDRRTTLSVAIATSLQVVARNPLMATIWGLTVAGCLVVASIPAFLGMVIVLPWLGHATWHLYRKAVHWPEA
jgi:uncharacterized membrane protein